MTYYIIFIYKN